MTSNIYCPYTFTEEDVNEINELYGPILIVGGSGFIGANLLNTLSKYRDDVFACATNINLSWRIGGNINIQSSHLFCIDITNIDEVSILIENVKPRTIFNLSAFGAYERQSDLYKIYNVNFQGTINLIERAKEIGFKAFVQAGSSSEYGLNCKQPKEADIIMPNSHYAVSKGASSLLIKYYGVVEGLPVNQLRLYSVYGPWEERDRLIPAVISYGLIKKHTKYADKNISRDFVYIDDCLRALIKSAIKGCTDFPGEIFNIGSGSRTTLEELSVIAKTYFNISEDAKFSSFPNRKWDLSEWYSNSEKIKNDLGWKTRIDLKTGIELSTKWEHEAQAVIRHIQSYKYKKKISCIVACYKDNQAIPIMYERVKKTFNNTNYDFEIIFVNDCSPLNDEDMILSITKNDPSVLGISHSRNFGSQSAFLSGLEICTGDAAVLLDGDLQDPPEIIIKFIEKWESGFDVVYGERVKREAKIYMQILYKLFYRVFRLMVDFKIPLDAGDFSLIDRKVINHLISFPEKDVFLRGLRAWVGFKQTGIPYLRPERLFGVTTNSFWKNVWWAKKGIFSFSSKPLDYIQKIGFGMFLISFFMAIFYLILFFVKEKSEAKGITTLVLLTLGLGGIQLLSISVLGDYIGKVLEEVKGRPKFIRASLIMGNRKISDPSEIENYIKKVRMNKDG